MNWERYGIAYFPFFTEEPQMFFIHKVQSRLYHGIYISQTENPVIPHLCIERESLPYPRSTSLQTGLLICKGRYMAEI